VRDGLLRVQYPRHDCQSRHNRRSPGSN